MSKKLHLNLSFSGPDVALFRIFLENLNVDEEGNPSEYPLGVEVVYEEAYEAVQHLPAGVAFDLWFAEPRDAYYFALRLQEAKAAWATIAAHAAELATYPKFLYKPSSRTWLRYNSPTYFCLVSESHLQVRRERPQELYTPEEVQVITEGDFLKAYQLVTNALREFAKLYEAEYLRRGSEGNEWFYRNPKGVAANTLPHHLRLNTSDNEYGRSWQFMYAHDTRRNDSRRVASTREEFEQQLGLMLAEVEAAATGQ